METATGTIERSEAVSQEKFVEAFFEHGGNAKKVAEALGCKPSSVNTRASKLRSQGIPLPRGKQGGGPRVDKAALLALIADKTGQSVEEVCAMGERLVKEHEERMAAKNAS